MGQKAKVVSELTYDVIVPIGPDRWSRHPGPLFAQGKVIDKPGIGSMPSLGRHQGKDVNG
jgi:hypothetical protein